MSPSDQPITPIDPTDHYEQYIPKPLPPANGRLWVQLLLLALTLMSTTFAGGCHYHFFEIDLASSGVADAARRPVTDFYLDPMFYLHGLWYSLTILAILGCHEMGHYVACLRYNVIATRPFFLPAPVLTGTLGAFIRIKSRIPNKTALFDIGIAGPIAGFVVAVPALFIGLLLSRIDKLPEDSSNLIELGEPMLFKFAAWLVFGHVADGYSINMHPMAFAAWFGLLATALNLFPIAQLDGGHISYAVLGARSTVVTIVMIGVAIGLAFMSTSWIVWTVLLIVMIATLGPRHPPTLYDDEPLGKGRVMLAVVAMVILVLCFSPVPIGEFLPGKP
ncbi:MAG TPA: site-2 protease family protein [Vicinamibacterales bacterium]|nr:site-2 protease family protein [Vicinamibacterales bacterium]